MNRKDLSCHCSFTPYLNVEMCSRREAEPTGLVTAEGRCLSCGFCVTDTLSHQQFHKCPTQNWNTHNGGIVGQKYNLKRVCEKPLGDDGGGFEHWGVGARSVNPEQKEDLNHLLIWFWQEQSPLCLEYDCTAGSAGILPKWIDLQLCKPNQLSSKW